MKKILSLILSVVIIFTLTSCDQNFFNPDAEPVSSTKMNLSHNVATLEVGATLMLETNIVAKKKDQEHKPIFKSSNVDIATVNEEGVITAKSEGTVTIEVTTEDALDDGQDTCEITVIPVKKVYFSGNIPIAGNAGKTYTIGINFENCSAPCIKVIADCGGGEIASEIGSTSFGEEEFQTIVSGKTQATVTFKVSETKYTSSIRLLCYDGEKLIDTKEYHVFMY